VPAVGGVSPQIIRIVVDLPAPFGPRNPNTSPAVTSTVAVEDPAAPYLIPA